MARRKWDTKTIKQVLDGEQPFVQVGYKGKTEKYHKVGDVWTDPRGEKWQQRDGYRIKVLDKANSIRDLVKSICSNCHKDLSMFGTREDMKIYVNTGKCYDCNVLEEDILRATGKFEEYEVEKVRRNQRSKLNELYQYTLESIGHLKCGDVKVEMVTSRGDVVTWKQDDVSEALELAEKDAELMKKDLDQLDDIIAEFDEKRDVKTETISK